MTIQKINSEMANKIIENRKPRGLFYVIENGMFVGIDNQTGDAWTEDFKKLRNCKKWLLGLDE